MLKGRRRINWVQCILATVLTATRLALVASSTTSSSKESSKFPQPGLKADPFVQASPLICAAVCNDGVLVVAAHVNVDDEEPLLYYTRQEDRSPDAVDSSFSFLDLPPNFQGPFRIHSVDTIGTCLVSAGWRADCEALLHKCRRMADEERSIFGVSCDDVSPLYARYLAMELSSYLAQCAVSERTRTMSCASLLVAPSYRSKDDGQVWLVDATGAYSVRALCIGGGGTSDGKMIADAVNQKLVEQNWTAMSTSQALETLLGIFAGSEQKEGESPRLIPKSTRLEVAVVESVSKPLTRRKLSSFAFIKDV